MPELPSGAVTFLFTDIEGSTRLVRQLRDRYADALAEHQRLLREAFSQHGGQEVDTQGDAFFYAFGSAHEAVLAAIEGQRALAGFPWPDDAPVKVRMGVHTGQAAPVNGRYTGLAVHRAARICAAGHGGQVLVSQATQSLLEDEEEDLAVNLRDLGAQRLKDIERPVRIYQVAAAGLPVTFPPLRREEEPPEAAPPLVPLYRRPLVLAVTTLVALAAVGAGVLLATRSGGGGLGSVRPNSVGVIDPETSEIVAEVPVGIRPGPVAVGAGSIWVGNVDDRTLTRIDPRQRASAGTISLGNQTPTGVAFGSGAVWVAHGLLGKVSRVDPQFGTVAETIENVAGRSESGAVAVGGGSVWIAYADSTVARINPASGSVAQTSFAGTTPSGIVYAERAIWVANAGEANVYRFNPGTFESGKVDDVTVGRRPTGISYGAGAIWVTSSGDDAVYRIDPASNAVVTIRVGDRPTAIAASDRAVWVANENDRTISRVDTVTNEVTKTIDVGNVPAGLAVGEGAVWVSVQAR